MRLLLVLLIFITNCSTTKVTNKHGSVYLKKKFDQINVNKTNKNDIISFLGPPSTISTFDNNLWIYIERKKTNQSLFKLGNKKIEENNVLVVQLNNKGLVENKLFYNLDDMNKINFEKKITEQGYTKNTYLYSFLTSLREKINSPVRNKKRNN